MTTTTSAPLNRRDAASSACAQLRAISSLGTRSGDARRPAIVSGQLVGVMGVAAVCVAAVCAPTSAASSLVRRVRGTAAQTERTAVETSAALVSGAA
jgi:hypothetical protein